MRYYMINSCLLPRGPILRPRRNTSGQTLVEYALILSLISIVAVSVMIALSGQVKVAFTTVDQQISIAGTGGPLPTPPPRGG